MKTYNLLVAGSKSVTDPEAITGKLDKLTSLIGHPLTVSVVGFGSVFPDIVRQWINDRGHEERDLLDYKGCDGALLFWDGESAEVAVMRNAMKPDKYRLIRLDNPLV